jgi:aspartate/methionine/tyrosine aminotransferase
MNVPPLAAEINSILEKEAPPVLDMLSALGRRLYFPKGIVSQGAEAKSKANRFNATIGIATEGKVPMHLPSIRELFLMDPADVFDYAPVAGKPKLREAWRDKLLRENPRMRDKAFGLPIVTSALTHGLALVAELFVDPGDPVILPDQYWENYGLTFEVRHQGVIETYPLFEGGRYHHEGLHAKLEEAAKHRAKAVVILNFPNNPTGFTASPADAEAIRAAILAAAERGLRQVVVCDDAYFGLFYEEDCLKESIFGYLAGLHPNVLAVKLDGATKEAFAWGFRVGFLSYGAAGRGDLQAVHAALEKKTMGAIRGGISNAPHTTQSAVLKALQSDRFEAERREKREILRERARRTREVLSRPEYAEAWTPYPFNSGYFMCVRIHEVDAEKLRLHLLDRYGVGVIASGGPDIRVAFSCLERDQIAEVFETLYRAWKDLRGARAPG